MTSHWQPLNYARLIRIYDIDPSTTLLSSLPRASSTTSKIPQPKRACGASSRVLDTPPGAPPFFPCPVPAQSSPRQPTSDISDDDMTLDGATANTDPIAFDSSPPWHLCLLPRAWAQCTVRKYTTTVIKLNLPSESPSGTSAAGPPSSKACHAVDHLSNPFDNSPTAYAAYTPLPPVLRDPRT